MSRKQVHNLFLLMCAAALLGFSVFVGTSVRDARTMEVRVAAQRNRLAQIDQQAAEILKSLEIYAEEEIAFKEFLFSERDVPAFLEGIAKYAQKADVNVVDMKTRGFEEVDTAREMVRARVKQQRQSGARQEAAQQKEDFKQILTLAAMPVTFKVEGRFSAFIEFLGYLEEFRQLITISSIQILSGSKYPSLECGFTLKIYSLKTFEELEYR